MRGSAYMPAIRVRRSATLHEVVTAIEAGQIGTSIIVEDSGRLVCTFTDGDVRRALLAGHGLGVDVEALMHWRQQSGSLKVVQAPDSSTRRQLLDVMQREVIRQIPLHDPNGVVVGIATLAELALPEVLAPRALIMAGGFGKRMGQYTATTPKPLLKVAGVSLIERIIQHLRSHGVSDIYVSVYHMADKIMNHLGDGSQFDASIRYLREEKPLGTGGAVGLLPQDDRPLLVMNGDLLTNFAVDAMTKFHRDVGAWLTMGVRTFEQQVAFGVVECDGLNVHRVQEKPIYRHLVNAGIYLLEPEACLAVRPGKPQNMTDVVATLLGERRTVTAFPIVGQWLDVGRPDDYERADREVHADQAV